jgi:short-subunit dehydrogenase
MTTTSRHRILLFAVLYNVITGTRGSLLEWGGDSSFSGRGRKSLLVSEYHHPHGVDATKGRRIEDDDDSLQLHSFPGARRRTASTTSTATATAMTAAATMSAVQLVNRVKMWPPWPLSLLQRENGNGDGNYQKGSGSGAAVKGGGNSEDNDSSTAVVTASNTYPSAAAVALAWCTQRARIGIRQLEEVGSSLWFHLPPTLPPLLLVASLPRKVIGQDPTTVRTILPIFSDPFARTLVLGGLGVAVLSWAHQELNRKKKLTPLGLPYRESSVSRVFLPPFLPEMVPEPEIEALQKQQSTGTSSRDVEPQTLGDDSDVDDDPEDSSQIFSMLNPRLRKHLSDIYESTPLSMGGGGNGNSHTTDTGERTNNPLRQHGFFREWKRTREVRKREAAKIRRATIFDELVALQAIKRRSARRARQSRKGGGADTASPGFALVTGASQGIGRALAVELARWEIPLVLVARDLDRLISLAYDLEACYGVRCCVLQADLSEIDAAERIHETTTKAGLSIDILVNNAGIAYEGLSANMETSLIERMIMINTMSFAKLGKLYGQDMLRRGRGRMLMVSSMAGLTSASPNTALYGATKSFERSLAFSMSKEFEPYGVGVTCLMPGPVTNTQFRSRSGTGRALCWYLPFYPRPAETVAHQGIMSLLDGDTQALPGWQNRAFAQIVRPILPQRVETMFVEAAWSPFRLPTWASLFGKQPPSPLTELSDDSGGLVNTTPPESVQLDLRPRYSLQMPPRLLQLPVKPIIIAATPPPLVEKLTTEPEPPITDTTSSHPTKEPEPADTRRPTEKPPPVESSNDITRSSIDGMEEEEVKSTKRNDDINTSPPSLLPTSTSLTIVGREEEKIVGDRKEAGPQQPPRTKSESPSSSSVSMPPRATKTEDDTVKCPDQGIPESEYQSVDQESDQLPPPARSETVGTRRHGHQPAKNLWPLLFDDDDENDNTSDLFVSPRLGAVDLFQEQRDYALPRLSQQSSSQAKPKWTVQT